MLHRSILSSSLLSGRSFFSDVPFVAKTIRCNSPLEGGFAYEAREIEASLKRKYEITE